MSPHLLRVPAEARPIDYETQVSANPALSFAVFDADALLGVVDSRAALRSPHRTFADLCHADPSPPIPDSSRPEEILAEMDRRQANVLPVIQADGRLLGVVSRSGMTEFLLRQSQTRPEESAERREAESLAEVGRLVSQSLDPEEVGQRIVESVLTLLRVHDSVLWRLEPESGDLVRVAFSGSLEPGLGPAPILPRGTRAAGLAVSERRPVASSDILTDPRITLTPEMRARLEQAADRAVLAVPLVIQDRVVGALGAGDRTGRVFADKEVRLLEAFASQAAVALDNSHLYGELRSALEEVKASQEQFVRGERLKALGELAGGVAHDFNNTLAVILGRAQFLLGQTEDPNLQRQLRVIERAAQDGARTVRRIQEFTRTRPARPHRTVDLNRVVQEAVELTRPRWKDEVQSKGIHFEVVAETAPLPPVAGDPAELREALTNLLLNALEAMPRGGRVTFRTAVEGERVCCVVTDTGAGMTEEVKRRVFDPFFTTKIEKGSGLGLSIVYGIITRHGGEIEVQSQPGQGSAFTIRLPGGRDIPEAPSSASPVGPRRTGRILVIDDEEEVREILCELLASRGHAVAACADGASGLTRLREEPFDLVITDLGMPGISGWEVARQVKLSSPGTPVAFVTGWGDRIDPEEARAKGVDFLVTKPFDCEAIAAVVARALTREDRGTGQGHRDQSRGP